MHGSMHGRGRCMHGAKDHMHWWHLEAHTYVEVATVVHGNDITCWQSHKRQRHNMYSTMQIQLGTRYMSLGT